MNKDFNNIKHTTKTSKKITYNNHLRKETHQKLGRHNNLLRSSQKQSSLQFKYSQTFE